MSLVLYLLLAAVIGLGRWMAVVQSAQDAARVAAREIALFPLPPDTDFLDALDDPDFQAAVYSTDFLVVDLETNPPGTALDDFFAAMPVVNRALRPLMITSTVDVGGADRRLLHMPGTLMNSATSPSGLSVMVPRVDGRDPATGAETGITLLPVLEEVGAGLGSPFNMTSSERGLVAIRLNVPYQSATLTAYLPSANLTPQGDPFNVPIQAVDLPGSPGVPILGPGPDGGPYSGAWGLGEQQALGQTVRPFRRVIAAQAIFRREVFALGS